MNNFKQHDVIMIATDNKNTTKPNLLEKSLFIALTVGGILILFIIFDILSLTIAYLLTELFK
jgi:hypothetical protein